MMCFFSKVWIDKRTHIQSEITGIRLQTNDKLLTLFKRLQRLMPSTKESQGDSKRFIDISFHIKLLTLVICDTVPGIQSNGKENNDCICVFSVFIFINCINSW
jgi:hypothetical protein